MASLLDPHGQPVRRQPLTERVGEPGLASVRTAWAPSVASGLTPVRLAAILAAAAEGSLYDYLVLAEEMEERDAHYASVPGVRKRAVSGVAPIVTPASDDRRDVRIADDVRAALAGHDGFTDLVEDMLDALGKGFSQVELIWGRGKRRWWIDDFVHRDPRFFTFDRDTGREVRLIDDRDMANGVALAPFKWISHKAKLKSGLVGRGGLARLVAFGWMCKSYTLKDWMAFVETYGLPLRLGRYGPGATAEDVETLFRAVANIGTDAAAVLPEAMRIDFEQVAGGPGNDIFETLARRVDEQTSKAVLGQTMTADHGSSMAQARVHDEVRHDIAKSDARAVSGTLMRDLVRPYVDLNHGVQQRYPRLSITIEDVEDTDMILRNACQLIGQGLRVRQSELRARLGFSEPDANDEVIGGAGVGAGVGAGAGMAGMSQARNRAHDPPANPPADPPADPHPHTDPDETGPNETGPNETGHPYAHTDDLEVEMLADWEEVMGDVLDPVLVLLEGASSYEQALEAIAQAFPRLGGRALIDALVKANVKARALGEADND